MQLIDTHLHLVYPEKLHYPWTAGSALDRAFRLADYRSQADACGIEAALHMEVDVAPGNWLDEVDFIAGLIAHDDNRLVGQIASCRPEGFDFAKQLEALQLRPTVKGVRRILHTSDDSLSQVPYFAQHLALLARADYSFDLCVQARQLLTVAQPLVRACGDVRFVIDHCGVPAIRESTDQTFSEWQQAIATIAAYPNVNCKLSGIVAYADAQWDVGTLRPYAEHIIASFGWDRVVWGSDWPVCTLGGGLTRWVEATHQLLAGCSETEKTQLLHSNAKTIYRL